MRHKDKVWRLAGLLVCQANKSQSDLSAVFPAVTIVTMMKMISGQGVKAATTLPRCASDENRAILFFFETTFPPDVTTQKKNRNGTKCATREQPSDADVTTASYTTWIINSKGIL